MSLITARFSPPSINTINSFDQLRGNNVPLPLDSNNSSFDFKKRFFDTVSSAKKMMKRFKATQKIASRANLFSKSDLKVDALKIISVATLPFILLELYRTVKKVCEVFLGVTIKDPLSDKAANAGTTALGVGKKIYDATDSLTKLIESTAKTNQVAADAISSISSKISVSKILGATLLPFKLFDIYSKVEKIYKILAETTALHAKQKFSRVTDQALSIVDNCVDITQIITGFVANATAVSVTGFLSAINIPIEAKKLYDAAAFFRKISGRNFSISDESNYDFKRNLHPTDKIKCILRPDDSAKEDLLGEIKKKLNKWNKSAHTEGIDQLALDFLGKASPEKIQLEESVQKAARLRSIQMITCHALKGLSSSVNIAAAAILFAAPPLAPASYGLLGVSSLISLSAFLFDNYVGQKWENTIVTAMKKIIRREWKAHQSTALSLFHTTL